MAATADVGEVRHLSVNKTVLAFAFASSKKLLTNII